MKRILARWIAAVAAFGLSAGRALAQTTCTINGEVVSGDKCDAVAGGILAFMGAFWIFFLVAGIFWLWMLIDAISKPNKDKAMWIIVLLLTGTLGAIVYFFAVKKKAPKTPTASTPTQ